MSLRVYKTVKVFKYQSHVGGWESVGQNRYKRKILSDFFFYFTQTVCFMKLYDIITIIYLKLSIISE